MIGAPVDKIDKATLVARFGYIQLVEQIGRVRAEARNPDELDRRVLLERLCLDLGVPEATLLERGFDKAYRRIIEGV